MKKTLIAAAVTGVFALPMLALAADAPASPHTLTGNLTLTTDYRFRGISQTFEKPAIQGGIDYSHSSGFYLGNWNSNVNEGAGFPESNLEMDFYGGYKTSFGDFGLDVGAIYYYYPGSDANVARGTTFTNPKNGQTYNGSVDNKEIYIGGSWKFVSLKYYHSVDDYFSAPDTKGSNYIDLSASYDLGNGWGINGHVGSLRVKNYHAGTDASDADYTDYKLGVTKDLNGWLVGLAYIGTDSKGSCDAANPGFYCFANSLPSGTAGVKTKDVGDDTVVLSITKTF
jgi:uncharacterized protein (TIGR02001 family)